MERPSLGVRLLYLCIAFVVATVFAMLAFLGQLWEDFLPGMSAVLAGEWVWLAAAGSISLFFVAEERKSYRPYLAGMVVYQLLQTIPYILFGPCHGVYAWMVFTSFAVFCIGLLVSARHFFPELFVERD